MHQHFEIKTFKGKFGAAQFPPNQPSVGNTYYDIVRGHSNTNQVAKRSSIVQNHPSLGKFDLIGGFTGF